MIPANQRHFFLAALLGAVMITTLACSPIDRPPSAPPAVPQATLARAPQSPTSAAQGGLGQVTLGDKLDSLASYRATFTLTAASFITSPGQINAQIVMIDERSRALDAERVIYTYSDKLRPDDYEHNEQVRLGSSSFLVIGGRDSAASCLAQPVRQSDQWELMPFFYSDLGILSDAKYAGDETLAVHSDQVRARHYVVNRSILGGFASGHADVWFAADGNYVVKMQAQASGVGPFQANPKFQGRLTASYQVSQINQPISIVPPTVCTGEAPIMPNAQEISVAGNLIAYKVDPPVSTAVEFYTQEMRTRGWSLVGEPSTTQDVTTLTFQRGNQTATVLISPSTQSQAVQVVFILAPSP